tara:strand:- start:2257 stop:3186 length:930 start_codon:yes stop_codon:yes gene_type:complete
MPGHYDRLPSNNLYDRPAQLTNNVNQYLNANQASLPQNQNMGGSLLSQIGSTSPTSPEQDYNTMSPTINVDDTDEGVARGPDITGQGTDLLKKLLGDLGSLTDNQQSLLLSYINPTGGDMQAGVSASEWAGLYGVSGDYADRFQGFPDLANIASDIKNIYTRGSQSRASELQSAQAALIANRGIGMGGFGGFGARGRSGALNRRQLMETLKQRTRSASNQVASEYGRVLTALNQAIGRGFSASNQIFQENPDIQTQGQEKLLLAQGFAQQYLDSGGTDRGYNVTSNPYYDDLRGLQRSEFDTWWLQQLG